LVAVGIAGLVVALVAAASGPGATERAETDSRHAERLCRAYAVAKGRDPHLIAYGGTTVRSLVLSSPQLHLNLAPWDKLPLDHFIAQCSLEEVPTAETPTTRCSNGQNVAVVERKPEDDVIIDDQGRVTTNPFDKLLKPPDLCSTGFR